ncbi:MAG: PLP-dependent aminotransferase family protein, partial [Lautropia sp.]
RVLFRSPRVEAVPCDAEGPDVDALCAPAAATAARLAYLVPNFQNPSGGTISASRRRALAAAANRAMAPLLLEDNPYGELWYDAAPPQPIAALAPERTIYLGSLSKVLSPGLRLGYLVAPRTLYPKLLQAKQAADLHTSGLTQRIAAEVLATGLLDRHLPAIRQHYKVRRDAMDAALRHHLGDAARWVTPGGGMFFWVALSAPIDTLAMLPDAVAAGIAYVPGAAFFSDGDPTPAVRRRAALRLSFATVAPERIDAAIATLAAVIRAHGERAGAA